MKKTPVSTQSLAALATLALVATALPAQASPQTAYPTKPIRLVIGFPAGGGADNTARLYGDALSRELGQPVIVDNRPGAGTTIAAEFVAKAPADGYTLYIATASLMGGDKVLYKNIKYEPSDFIPITRLVAAPMILAVNKDIGIRNVADLVAQAKAHPGSLNYSSSGNGVITHLAGVYFTKLAGVKMTHVPYKGGAPSAQAVAAGDVQLTFGTAPSVKPMIDTGKIVPIAVTSAQRSPANPQLPTIAEGGVKGYDLSAWYGLFAPAKTPPEIIDKLYAATAKVMANPELKKKFLMQGDEVAVSASVAEFQEYAAREGRIGVDLAVSSGAKID
ncbi:Tripartite-type tricarboxylate transporter, receptor component TctC [Cupriavidus sp. OV038]|jgi:tripartite-type tricarboxylate transporter receptor subunit TctC|uniref:tripartite tricarboxylate transporter substrate binding protein n=1 Tax=unclassified Cupriavidus TaxID=2640874 RepID=UPI0008E3E26E|nr:MULTISPECIES: tripartite tricarboxylate transporter substrate binding protein [unclassified Cupriavidus]SFC62720.1 Tripartite-type tricarboxylate transporter, receptor component TctC [Cupriavidus sp. OV038]SFP40219.1 Tripartite-type tricarboxylate transporter, receptor component TctC [Cupriavidus sp. OV096]